MPIRTEPDLGAVTWDNYSRICSFMINFMLFSECFSDNSWKQLIVGSNTHKVDLFVVQTLKLCKLKRNGQPF